MKKKLLIVILYLFDFLLTQYTTMYLWNGIISWIFKINTLSFYETVALTFFVAYIRYKPNEQKVENWIELISKDLIATTMMLGIGYIVINCIL